MADLSIVYYTSNREDEGFEKRIQDNILSVTDLPIISVSHKPIDFGENICVGNVGTSGFNMFRQVQIACEAAKTKYVISTESDCLYPPDYFKFTPKRDNVFYRNQNCYLMGHRRNYFYRKIQGSSWSQVVGREHYLKILSALFFDAPEWCENELNFPKERTGHPDVSDVDVFYTTIKPCISFKTGKGMRHYSKSERIPIYDLPYWGSGKELKQRFCG